MRKKVHISWHIAAVCAGVILGVAAALAAPAHIFAGAEWPLTALALALAALISRRRWALALAGIGGALLGLWLGALKQIDFMQYQPFYGQEVTLQGKVTEDTTFGPQGGQRLRLGGVVLNGRRMGGNIWVSANTSAEIKRGDIVTVEGELSEGFGNLPATMFYARLIQAERPQPGDVARRVRDWFAGGVRTAVDEPQANLGLGYLVGQRTALPETLADQFRLLGLVHLVVASGSNLIIIARLLKRWAGKISKFTAAAATLAFIGGFLLLTGFSTSMTRAALVASLSLLAWYYGRIIHPVVLLLLAAAITLCFDPSFLWGDMGWYLSFAAFAGVILLAPLIHRYFWGEKEPGVLRYIVVATTAAQITTFPVIAISFGEYSPLALAANLLIQPLVPLAMGLTFAAGLAGVLVPAVAGIFGLPAQVVLSYMTGITGWMSGLPLAAGEIAIGWPVLAGMYGAVLLAIFYLRRRTGYRFRRENLID